MRNSEQYVAFDVHSASCRVFCRDEMGKRVFERTVPTERKAILEVMAALTGRIHVAFEEGNLASWMYELLAPRVAEVIVCNPRENRSGRLERKTDRIDAERLSLWLYKGILKSVYHEEHGTRRLGHLVRIYDQLVADQTRSKNRLKALYTSQAIRARGRVVYGKRGAAEWLERLPDDGARARAQLLVDQIAAIRPLVTRARHAMTLEARKHPAFELLTSIPGLADIRAAQLLAALKTPWRFRRNRQLWAYAGLAVVTRGSAEIEYVNGVERRRHHATTTRGLNRNGNRRVKAVLKGAAISACGRGELKPYYDQLLTRHMRPELAKVTLARKIATLVLTLWKKGERFDVTKLSKLSV